PPVASAFLATTSADASQPEVFVETYRVTAYCDRGVTAAGVPVDVGQCAAPAGVPFGARIYIPELNQTFIVTDRTALRFRHNTVDLFMPERQDCKRFGCHKLECIIEMPRQRHRYGSDTLIAAVRELFATQTGAREETTLAARRADEATLARD